MEEFFPLKNLITKSLIILEIEEKINTLLTNFLVYVILIYFILKLTLFKFFHYFVAALFKNEELEFQGQTA